MKICASVQDKYKHKGHVNTGRKLTERVSMSWKQVGPSSEKNEPWTGRTPEISGLQFLKQEGDSVRKLKIVSWIGPGFHSLIHRTLLTVAALALLPGPSGLSLDRATLVPSVRALIFQGHSKINTRDPNEGCGDRGTQPGLAVNIQSSLGQEWLSLRGLWFVFYETVITTETMI